MSDPQMVGRGLWGAANRMTWLFEVRRRSHGNEGERQVIEEEEGGRNGAVAMVMARRQGRGEMWLLKSNRMAQSQWLELKSDQRRVDACHVVWTEHPQALSTSLSFCTE
jgi:hypothetical protein